MSAVGDARKRLADAEGAATHWQQVVDLRAKLAVEKVEHRATLDVLAECGKNCRSEQARADRAEDLAHDYHADCWAELDRLREALAEANAEVNAALTFADELDAGASLRWTGDVAKELRGVLGGGLA